MSKRPSRRIHAQDETVHLNITPFIDILICLILFLLTSAAVIKLAVVDTSLPALAAAPADSKQNDKEQLVVSIDIRDSGFLVGRIGTDSKPERQRYWQDGGSLRAEIPKTPQGKYDFSSLNRQMQRIKSAYPDAVSAMLLPTESVNYETIVDVMDAIRDARLEKKRVLLFPDAVIGHISEPQVGRGT